MARAYKILGQSIPNSATITDFVTLYTVPGSTQAVVSSLVISSLATSAGTSAAVYVAVQDAAAAVTNKHSLCYGVNVPSADTVTMTLGITLASGSVVKIAANTVSSSFTLFGTEIT